MKILVCIKQVPEHAAGLRINARKTGIEIPDAMKFRMNRFDEHAVEAAVTIREKHPDTMVDVITVGPQSAAAVVKRAMGMGADNGHLIALDSFENQSGYHSPAVISSLLAGVSRQLQYDLVLTGIMSEDEMNAQTGQMLAARLGLPCVSGVVKIKMSGTGIRVLKEREGGVQEELAVRTPVLFTIQAGINQPRYPALSALLRANAREIKVWNPEDLDFGGVENDQSVIQIREAGKMRQGRTLEGSIAEKARQFMDIMQERNALK